jgi:signal transduction histidine kinase
MAESAQDQLYFLLTVGTAAILTLAFFIILFFFIYQKRIFTLQRQKQQLELDFQEKMNRAQLESQEQDRARIAADLHDSVGSLLWGAKLNASVIARSAVLPETAQVAHGELMTVLDQTIQAVRRIAWQLTPEVFQHEGLVKSLERLCHSVNGKGIAVTFEAHDPSIWNDAHALQVFRIVQELISNSIKHAQASSIQVSLHCPGDTRYIVVQDDGIGYQPSPDNHGVGWWSIRQRARRIGAEIIIGLPPNQKGLSVTISIPLPS